MGVVDKGRSTPYSVVVLAILHFTRSPIWMMGLIGESEGVEYVALDDVWLSSPFGLF